MFVAIASQNLLTVIFALSVYPPGSVYITIKQDFLYTDGVVRQKVIQNHFGGGSDVRVGGCGTDINSILRSGDVQRLSSCLQ